jgi:hypothetical protein
MNQNAHEVAVKALEAARAYIEEFARPQETYGHFPGGDYDPRKFSPDEECCTPAELAAHKAACEAWERGERPQIAPSLGEVEQLENGVVLKHECSSPLGIGGYVYVDEELVELLAQIDEAIAEMGPP